MKKRIIYILTPILLLLWGCVKDGQRTEITEGNERFNPVFLFEVDGIRVYRFQDGGRYVYFTNVTGNTEYEYTTRNGNTPTTRRIQTLGNSDFEIDYR